MTPREALGQFLAKLPHSVVLARPKFTDDAVARTDVIIASLIARGANMAELESRFGPDTVASSLERIAGHGNPKAATMRAMRRIIGENCTCPAASEYDPPCPKHGVRAIGMRGDGSYVPGEYDHDPPHVVGSDTSKAAAESMAAHAPILREQVLTRIVQRGALGATCDEIEVNLNGRHQTISARVRELAKAGLIVDSGKRRPTRSGRTATVYVTLGELARKR